MTKKERIKYADEIERIEGLSLELFFKMSCSTIGRLTSDFFEPLVRLIFAKTSDPDQQRDLLNCMENAYEEYGMYTAYPGYDEPEVFLDNFRFEIDCGRIITLDGSKPAPKHASLTITPVTGSIPFTQNDKDILIATLRAELEQMKQKVKELQDSKLDAINEEELDVIFPLDDSRPTTRGDSWLKARIKELEDENKSMKQQLKEANKTIEVLQLQLKENSSEEQWIDWLDGDVFHYSINAEEIYKFLCNTPTPHLKDRPRCYVLFRVLTEIKGLKKGVQQKNVLKWWNVHFNCGWDNDNQFKFSELPENIKINPISKWKNCEVKNNQHYYAFAQALISALAWNSGGGKYEIKTAYLKQGSLPPK